MPRQNILTSPRIEELKRKKRKTLRNRIIFSVFCFLVLFFGLGFLSRWNKMNISSIQIFGNKVIETEVIEKIARENMASHYLWLFPKTNFVLCPKRKIKNNLEKEFKRFLDISIKTDKNVLEINVIEREGKYTWCGILLPVLENSESQEKCYFMDGAGYVFDEAPYFSGNVYFKFYGPVENAENPTGKYFLAENFSKIVSFADTLKKLDFIPTAFYLDNDGYANILISQNLIGPKITFKLDSNYEKIAENLQAIIATAPLQAKLKNNFSSLLYINLSFGNNVVYKFK